MYYYSTMRIGEELPFSYVLNSSPQNKSVLPLGREQSQNQGPGVILDISPAGWAAAGRGDSTAEALAAMECQTCNSRKYQDVSSDSSVSFQSPTHIGPGQAASAVAAHEAEHLSNDRASAEREGREIVSQTMRLKTSICPECKVSYVSCGEARTISISKADTNVDIEV